MPNVLAYLEDSSSTRTNKPISSKSSGSSLIAPRNILSIESPKFLPKAIEAPFATVVSCVICSWPSPALVASATCFIESAKAIAPPEAVTKSREIAEIEDPPVALNLSIDSVSVSI